MRLIYFAVVLAVFVPVSTEGYTPVLSYHIEGKLRQVADPDGIDEGTYSLRFVMSVSASSTRRVRKELDSRRR